MSDRQDTDKRHKMMAHMDGKKAEKQAVTDQFTLGYTAALQDSARYCEDASWLLSMPQDGSVPGQNKMAWDQCFAIRAAILALTPPDAEAAMRRAVEARAILAWHNFDAWTHWAEAICGTYCVEERNAKWRVQLRIGGLIHDVVETDDTTQSDLEAAKSAAQADYTRRILAALGWEDGE